MEPFNIANWITAQAEERPHQRAIVFPEDRGSCGKRAYTQLTFKQTEQLINQYARGFINIGIKKGDRVSLFVRPCLEFMPITFALYKIGAVVVLIDPGMGREGLLSCIERIAPRALVAIPQAMAATVLFPKKFKSIEIKVTVGNRTWLWGGHRIEDIRSNDGSSLGETTTTREDEASILFTSGSTGPAKGVRYTHGVFDAQTRQIKHMYNIQAGEIDLPCFPLFGLFSLAMGMTVVVPDMDPTKPAQADPKLLMEAIEDQGVSTLFASPALLKPFVSWCLKHQKEIPSVHRILSAGAPIPPQLHSDFRQILPEGAEIHTPYGATESLPVATISSAEVLSDTQHRTNAGEGTCVGNLAPEITVRIIDICDDPIESWSEVKLLEQGEIGEICVLGPVVTTEYKEEPEHTKMAKIYGPNGEIWHRMGDVGYFDKQGRLWFCGRKSHRVQLGEELTLYPVPCEGIFNLHPDVARSALVARHGEPVIIIEKRDPHLSEEKLRSELLELGAQHSKTELIKGLLFHPSFPVDVRHNAKIHRPKLAAWANQQQL